MMILSALVVAAALTSPVEDYFPLTPGTKWTYEDANGLQTIDEVGKPMDVGKGVMATPKLSTTSGHSAGSELYRVDADMIILVGHFNAAARQPLTLMDLPQPVLKVDNGKAEWQYQGELATSLGPVLLQVNGDSSKGPKRKILDSEVDTLNVHVVSRIGNDAQRIEVRDDAVYGKGIGLCELTEVTKAQGQTVKKVLKLVKFEPHQG